MGSRSPRSRRSIARSVSGSHPYRRRTNRSSTLRSASSRRRDVSSRCRTAAGRPRARSISLIHFHGAPTAVEPAFERSGIDGVLGIINLGIGSGAYETALQMPGSFDEVVQRFTSAVHEMCPGSTAAPKRIALSGWSAGYGAVFRVLDRQRDASRVDAVLLADGLHASIDPTNKYERHVMVDHMAPFTAFADEAVAGNKLFAITHSQIQTPYASTTETADFLLAQEGVTRAAPNLASPRPGMVMKSRGDAGKLPRARLRRRRRKGALRPSPRVRRHAAPVSQRALVHAGLSQRDRRKRRRRTRANGTAASSFSERSRGTT